MNCEPGASRTARLSALLLLLAGAALFVLPFYWMITTSLKPLNETISIPPTWWPSVPQWQNYPGAIDGMKYFWRFTLNTLWIAVLSVGGGVLSCALAAYGFSRVQWAHRDRVFVLVLVSMMLPFAVTVVPLYALYRNLDWIGTSKPLWAPAFLAPAFGVFMLRQFFLTLPKELNEAARIDGCSEWRIFWQIILPLSKPPLAVVALFQFLGSWNDFFGPLVYLTEPEQFTLSLGLLSFQSQQGGTEWHYLMAAVVLMTLPVVVLYFLCQRSFTQSIAATGTKH